MTTPTYRYVFLGLSITSSWGNGHATTYRALLRALASRGHHVLFLERNLSIYDQHRDLPNPPYGKTEQYSSIPELRDRFSRAVREADLVIVGSFVPEGATVGAWITEEARGKTAFYDLDTPVTLGRLAHGDHAYLTPALIPRYDLYLSATGGPTLERLERGHGAVRARALYCSADTDVYHPQPAPMRWDLGYLGTYSDDRQAAVERLLLEPARRMRRGRFAVAGAQYPASLAWPENITRTEHLPPDEHRIFYNAQRFTLNLTRRAMVESGWSPSARLFEAAACGTPVLSDTWPGIETFFQPGEEILLVRTPEDVLRKLREMKEDKRLTVGQRARQRVFAEHTAMHRAEAFERYTREVLDAGSRARARRDRDGQLPAAQVETQSG
ncbi:CgeB family protein [Sorangium sp. So ce1335]|uniref:CgeB family protein n=1 Tax=Sorangium sp. So ce1335 TaxID=3133335 RepID=UPI003F60EE30